MNMRLLSLMAATAVMSVLPFNQAFASGVDDPLMVRVRGIVVAPDEGGEVATIGGDVDIKNEVVPELDITYFLQENVALELILATNNHDAAVLDSAIDDVDLGDVWLLPPTLLAQYHFSPRGSVRPYVGAGVNYTFFYGNDHPTGLTSVNYDNGFGFALQGGVDIPVNDDYFINFDVKKLFLSTDVTVDAGGTIVTADVDIDPWIFGVGFGRRF